LIRIYVEKKTNEFLFLVIKKKPKQFIAKTKRFSHRYPVLPFHPTLFPQFIFFLSFVVFWFWFWPDRVTFRLYKRTTTFPDLTKTGRDVPTGKGFGTEKFRKWWESKRMDTTRKMVGTLLIFLVAE